MLKALFGRLGKLYDEMTKRFRVAWAFIVSLAFSRLVYIYYL
jgi:hypothetical protein